MPRQPRFWFPGAVLHVVQRGNNRSPVFVSDDDRLRFIDHLLDASRKHGVAIHAYVLMTNHVHLLASPCHAEAMPRMMQTVGRRYVGRFNRVHDRTGTLWEGRYRAAPVDTDSYFFACMRYIELNPVRAGMVRTPIDYRWSSHCGNALGERDALITIHDVYAALGNTPHARREAYRKMFESPLTDKELDAIRDATQFEWALAGESARRRMEALTGRRTARLSMGPSSRSLDE
jgi:putative transposase